MIAAYHRELIGWHLVGIVLCLTAQFTHTNLVAQDVFPISSVTSELPYYDLSSSSLTATETFGDRLANFVQATEDDADRIPETLLVGRVTQCNYCLSRDSRCPHCNGVRSGRTGGAGSGGATGDGGGDGNAGLSGKVLDPTQPLDQLTFQYTWDPSYYGLPSGANQFKFQPVIPHKSFGINQILRCTIAYQEGPADDGLRPAQLFNLGIFEFAGGNLGVGPLFNFLPNTGPDSDAFQLGPAVGWVGAKGKWTYGLFNQNLFSEKAATIQFQPLLGYAINEKWSLALGDTQLTYDAKAADDWVLLPLGVQVNRIAIFGKTPVRFFYNPLYNFQDFDGSYRWQHSFGMTLITK